ncbi:MAG TPA: 4a-hydroxytetrahydrobiopterin dehydratase [Gemmatimonadales bacterium]|nr:4a-hydroxytetrahydrobiopterin dehydratase [Gemmatimonadales bacterium]
MKTLSEDEVRKRLSALPGWSREGNAIGRTYTFESFPAAIAFVDRIAELAEAANHHPDIDIRYDRVRLSLSTHSEGGITSRDTDLAARIDETLGAPS